LMDWMRRHWRHDKSEFSGYRNYGWLNHITRKTDFTITDTASKEEGARLETQINRLFIEEVLSPKSKSDAYEKMRLVFYWLINVYASILA
jgi:hypothetical protein